MLLFLASSVMAFKSFNGWSETGGTELGINQIRDSLDLGAWVDFDTLGQGDDPALTDTVTIRDRDSMAQERVAVSELAEYVRSRLN